MALPFFPFDVRLLSERYFVIFAPIVYAGFGIGLWTIARQRRLRLLGVAATAGLLLVNAHRSAQQHDARYLKDQYHSMFAAIAALTSAEDKVFFVSASEVAPQVHYYLDKARYDAPKDDNARYINVTGLPYGAVDDLSTAMARIFTGFPRFWLLEIEAAADPPTRARVSWIEEHYHRVFHIPVGHNSISLFSIDPNEAIPISAAVIPPVVKEARPADQVRIGVPAGAKVDLIHSGQVVDTRLAETWTLHQFDIYAFYFNGYYELRAANERYPFIITHSRDFPREG